MSKLEKSIISEIKKSIGQEIVKESYVTQAKKYDIKTELLSNKTKDAHQKTLEAHVNRLNEISISIDAAELDLANDNSSKIRSLKEDEVYNLNASLLHAFYFENIGDVNSVINMDSLAFMRLERDFGSFDSWQKDFIACGLSARSGWVMTVYNFMLGRYMNVVVDSHDKGVPVASYPVIVVDCWEHAYFRDYLGDRKSYIYAMMKELKWTQVEQRIRKVEAMSKVAKGKTNEER